MRKIDIAEAELKCILIAVDYRNGWNDAVDAMRSWISVEERLPERYTDVAIIERDGVHWWYKVAYLGACDVWALNGGHRVLGDVTHWMPLPELPEEEANES